MTARSGAFAFTNGIGERNGFIFTNAAAGQTITATVQNAGGGNLGDPGNGTSGIDAGDTVSPAAGDHLTITQEPSNAATNAAIAPAITVEIRDQFDNLRNADTSEIAVAILNNAGPGGTLGGDVDVNAVAGESTFNDLEIDVAGNGYTLRFTYSPGGLVTSNTVDSAAFNIGATATITGDFIGGTNTEADVVET